MDRVDMFVTRCNNHVIVRRICLRASGGLTSGKEFVLVFCCFGSVQFDSSSFG